MKTVSKILAFLWLLLPTIGFGQLSRGQADLRYVPIQNPADGLVVNQATSNTTAINNAITSVSSSTTGIGAVQLGVGTYWISTNIQLKSGVTLRGMGRDKTIIKLLSSSTSGGIAVANSSTTGQNDIAIEDLTVDGNYTNRPSATATPIVIASATGQCQRIRVSRVGITDSPFAGMHFFNCVDVWVENCFINGTQRDGIVVWDGSSRVNIENNKILETGDDCIALNSQRPSEQRYRVEDVVIKGNICKQKAASVLGSGIRIGGAARVVCSSNIVKNAYGTGIAVDGGSNNGGGDGATPVAFSVVTGTQGIGGPYPSGTGAEVQTITLTGTTSGGPWEIEFQGEYSLPIMDDSSVALPTANATAAQVQTALQNISSLAGNVTVTGSAGGPYTFTFGSTLGDVPPLVARPYATSRDVIVSNNVVTSVGNAANSNGGINCRANSAYCQIVGNKVSFYYQHGITVSAPGTLIEANYVGAGQNNSSSYGINVTGAQCSIIGNRVWRAPWHGIYLNANNLTVTGNSVTDAGQWNATSTGIRVETSCNHSVITGNNCVKTSRGTYGIRVPTGSQDYLVIVGNIGYGYGATNGLLNESTGTHNTVTNNVISP